MNITDTIYENLNEDVSELITFIYSHNKDLAQELNQKLGEDNFIHSLEELILNLSKIFGICAFEQENDLKVFNKKISEIIHKDNIFKNIINIYVENVDLSNINPDIKNKDFQVRRLKVFIESIK